MARIARSLELGGYADKSMSAVVRPHGRIGGEKGMIRLAVHPFESQDPMGDGGGPRTMVIEGVWFKSSDSVVRAIRKLQHPTLEDCIFWVNRDDTNLYPPITATKGEGSWHRTSIKALTATVAQACLMVEA